MSNNAETIDALKAEITSLRQRVQELEQPQPPQSIPLEGAQPALPALHATTMQVRQTWALLQTVLDTIPDPVFVKDLRHRWVACNQGFCTLIGHPYEAIIGRSDPDLWPLEQAHIFWEMDDKVFASNEPVFNEEQATGSDGITRTIWTRKFPMHDADEKVIGLCGIITDISEIKQRQRRIERLEIDLEQRLRDERLALQQEIIEAQQRALRELSTPLIPISERVVIMPLIGAIDSRRAQQVLETLLEGVAAYNAEMAILDITGVSVVDTQVAQAIVRAAQAVKLLGTQVMLTGIQPQIAQTIVHLGIDLSGIITRGSLQAGIAYALWQKA